VVSITPEGEKLKDKALSIPPAMGSCVKLSPDESQLLYKLLYKIIGNVR
jgi:hypothetical protein